MGRGLTPGIVLSAPSLWSRGLCLPLCHEWATAEGASDARHPARGVRRGTWLLRKNGAAYGALAHGLGGIESTVGFTVSATPPGPTIHPHRDRQRNGRRGGFQLAGG